MEEFLESILTGNLTKEGSTRAKVWWIRDDYSHGHVLATNKWQAINVAENLVRGELGGIIVVVISGWQRPVFIGARHDEGRCLFFKKLADGGTEWLCYGSDGVQHTESSMQAVLKKVSHLMQHGCLQGEEKEEEEVESGAS